MDKNMQLFQNLIKKMSDKADTPKAQKAAAIADQILQTTGSVLRSIHVAYPKKRIFRKIDRRPIKRIRRLQARVFIPIYIETGWMNLYKIYSQTIPKFKDGTAHPGGTAIVGESGPEIILSHKLHNHD